MNHPVIESRMKAIQKILIATYEAGVGLPSNVSGRERGVFLRSYLSQIFPSTIRFGSGVITDVNGKQSGQLDIVVERPHAVSLPLPLGDERVFLADNIGAVIEVKSNLATQWKEVTKTTSKVLELEYQEVFTGLVAGEQVKKVPIFAVGYTGYKTHEGLKKRLDETPSDQKPSGALCLDTGFFIFDVAGNSGWGKGAMGLFFFASVLNHQINRVMSNLPSIKSYLQV